MIKYVMSALLVLGMSGFSFGGECLNGFCKKAQELNSVRSKRVVVKTPWIVRRPVVTQK